MQALEPLSQGPEFVKDELRFMVRLFSGRMGPYQEAHDVTRSDQRRIER
jgi:hypothetical protein